MFNKFKKNKAIKSYISTLPTWLTKDYGVSEHYTPVQVLKSIERHGLSKKFSIYALAIYATKTEYLDYISGLPETYDFSSIRSELADNFFSGEIDFLPPQSSGVYEGYSSSAESNSDNSSSLGH